MAAEVKEIEYTLGITMVPTELIDDNPFGTRMIYVEAEVEELGDSLLKFGLRQVPTGRRKDGRVQLAFGGKRLRAFRRNEKQVSEKKKKDWQLLPLVLKELTDVEMFDYGMVENMQRSDVKPIEVARAIARFTEVHPEVKDKDIAKKHGMSEANVSNMKRVLRLPAKFLDMVDAGTLSFTQGRELLTVEGIEDPETLMSEAVVLLSGEGFPNTVEGLQRAIDQAVWNHYPCLEKDSQEKEWKTIFDPERAGCLKCKKTIITHPTKNKTQLYCLDIKCWEEKTDNKKSADASVASLKQEAEAINKEHEAESTGPAASYKPEPVKPISQAEEGAAAKNLSQEKSGRATKEKPGKGAGQAAEKPATIAELISGKEAAKPAETVTRPTESETKTAVFVGRMVIEETSKGVTVSLQTNKGFAVDGLEGTMVDALPKLPGIMMGLMLQIDKDSSGGKR